MRYKDFEIVPTRFVDGHKDKFCWSLIKKDKLKPMEETNIETGERKTKDTVDMGQL